MRRFGRYRKIWTAVFFFAIDLIYVVQIPFIKISNFAVIDSVFFPKLLAACLTILSVVELISGIRDVRKTGEEDVAQTDESAEPKTDMVSTVGTLGISILYVIMMEPLGFVISSVIYVFVEEILLCPKEAVNYVKFAVIAVASALAVYFAFRHGLNLMLPAGILSF